MFARSFPQPLVAATLAVSMLVSLPAAASSPDGANEPTEELVPPADEAAAAPAVDRVVAQPEATPAGPAPTEAQPATAVELEPVETDIVAASPAAAPESVPAPTVVEPEPRRKKRAPVDPYDRAIRKQEKIGMGMTIGGFALLGMTYLGAAYTGTSAIDEGRDANTDGSDDTRLVAYGNRLLIPIAGPFAAAAVAPSATEGLATALVGVAQTAGLAVGIAGSVVFAKARKKRMERLAVSVAPAEGGAMLSVAGRF